VRASNRTQRSRIASTDARVRVQEPGFKEEAVSQSIAQGGVHLGKGEGKSFWLLTDRFTFKVDGDTTSGAFTVAEVAAGPEMGPPPHIHRDSDEASTSSRGSSTSRWRAAHSAPARARSFTCQKA
jgi:hypothetical protein